MVKEDNVLPKPFLGRLLIEAMDADVEEHLKKAVGLSSDSRLALPDSYKEQNSVPVKKGRVIDMAVDAFGDAFRNKYGEVGKTPELGDVVYFIPGQSYKIDIEAKYHLISDEDIMATETKTGV